LCRMWAPWGQGSLWMLFTEKLNNTWVTRELKTYSLIWVGIEIYKEQWNHLWKDFTPSMPRNTSQMRLLPPPLSSLPHSDPQILERSEAT
jgi:hypothetical protein